MAWRQHITVDHDPLEYVALAITVRMRHAEGAHMTVQEMSVLDHLLAHDASVIPSEACVALVSASDKQNAAKIARDAQLSALGANVKEMASKMGEVFHTLRSQGNEVKQLTTSMRTLKSQFEKFEHALEMLTPTQQQPANNHNDAAPPQLPNPGPRAPPS